MSMRVLDLFSKRQRKLRGEVPDVYTYDEIPNGLRVQIIHIVRDAFGTDSVYASNQAQEAYQFVNDALCREYGVFTLVPNARQADEAVFNFLLQATDIER